MYGTYSSQHSNQRRGLTGFLAVVLAVSLSLSLVTLVIKQTVLNYDLAMQIIDDQALDQKLASILPGFIFEQLTGNAAPAVSTMLADPSAGFASSLIPPDWVKFTLKQSARSMINSLESGSDEISIFVDLSPIKQQLTATSAEITAKVINQMPKCTAEQLLSYAASALSGDTSALPFCKPGEPFTRLITPIVANWVAGLGSKIPSEMHVPVFSMTSADSKSPLLQALKLIRVIMPFQKPALAASVILLVIILGINWKMLPQGIRWLGVSLLIAAGLLLFALVISTGFAASIHLGEVDDQPLMKQMGLLAIDYLNTMINSAKAMLIKLIALLGGSGVLFLMIAKKNGFIWQDQPER